MKYWVAGIVFWGMLAGGATAQLQTVKMKKIRAMVPEEWTEIKKEKKEISYLLPGDLPGSHAQIELDIVIVSGESIPENMFVGASRALDHYLGYLDAQDRAEILKVPVTQRQSFCGAMKIIEYQQVVNGVPTTNITIGAMDLGKKIAFIHLSESLRNGQSEYHETVKQVLGDICFR